MPDSWPRAAAQIARQHLGIDTLEREANQHEDHSVFMKSIRDALDAAFLAGMSHGRTKS